MIQKPQEPELDRKYGVVRWILSRPEGKQFLSACLIVIVALSAVIVWEEGVSKPALWNKVENCSAARIADKQDLNERYQRELMMLYAKILDYQVKEDKSVDSVLIKAKSLNNK